MNFNTIKEMESELLKITNLDDFAKVITFRSQGVIYNINFAGEAYGNKREIYYVGNDNACNVRITFSGERNNISVSEVSIKMF